MRTLVKLSCAATVSALLLTTPVFGAEQSVLKTERDKVNYAIGVNVVNTFKQQGVDVDPQAVIRGMQDAFAGKLLLPDEELHKAINQYYVQVRQKRAGMAAKTSAENKKAGEAFLAENARKAGVTVLPSGLQYRVLQAGNGAKPGDADTVACRYRGVLINGAEFDSSPASGEAGSLKVSSLVPGWREALKMMPAGSKWQLFIPPGLAYGERGSGTMIGPNAALIIELELVAIK